MMAKSLCWTPPCLTFLTNASKRNEKKRKEKKRKTTQAAKNSLHQLRKRRHIGGNRMHVPTSF